MALHRYYDPDMGYNMGYPLPYYERDDYRQAYYDGGPVMYRQADVRRREPYFGNYRRDYRQGDVYTDGRYGVLPLEEVRLPNFHLINFPNLNFFCT